MNIDLMKRTTESATQTLLLDALAEDGAIIDPLSKIYDEKATLKGGDSDRMAFTRYNSLITSYHKILKIIKGESRANIYEEIPVVDFFHKENTGFDKRYDRSGDDLHAASILPIEPIAKNSNAVEYIENEDPYTINRIINGEETAEFLFNTSDIISEDPNIQVSPFIKGITKSIKKYIGVSIVDYVESVEKEVFKSIRKPEISSFKFAPEVESLEGETAKKYNYDINDYNLDGDDSITGENEKLTIFIFPDDNVPESHDQHPVKVASKKNLIIYPLTTSSNINGENFVTSSTVARFPQSGLMKENRYTVTLKKNDIFFFIPGESTVDEPGIALVFKYIKEESKNFPGTHYEVYGVPAIRFSADLKNQKIENFKVGDALPEYLFETQEMLELIKAFVELDICYYSTASGLLSGFFSVPMERETFSEENFSKVSKWKFDNDYIRAWQDAEIEISPGTKYFQGHLLKRGKFYESPLAPTAHDYISTAETYDDKNGTVHTVTADNPFGSYGKIKSLRGNDLYISLGVETYKKENIEGKIIFSRVASNTEENKKLFSDYTSYYKLPKGIKGKAGILLDVVNENLDNILKFKGIAIPKDEWIATHADTPLRSITFVASKVDYSGEEISTRRFNELQLNQYDISYKDLDGRKVLDYNLGVKGKLITKPGREAPGAEDFKKYFDALTSTNHPDSNGARIEKKNGKTILYISSSDTATCAKIEKISKNGYFFPTGNTENSLNDDNTIETDLNKSFYFKAHHTRQKWRWDKNYGDYKYFKGGVDEFKLISPAQIFLNKSKNLYELFHPGRITLVYPEYPDVFPERLYLVSNVDLHLRDKAHNKQGGMVSFYTPTLSYNRVIDPLLYNGNVISFGISNAYSFKPSEVTTLNFYDHTSGKSVEIERKEVYMESHEVWETVSSSDRIRSSEKPSSDFGYNKNVRVSNVHPIWSVPDYSRPDAGSLGERHIIGYYYDEEVERKRTVWTRKEVDHFPQLTSDLDCYIYELCPLSLSIDGRPFYNQEDQKFDLMDGPGSFLFNPLSYPSDSFFPVEAKPAINDKKTIIKVVKPNHRSDINTLRNALIIPDIPEFDNVSELDDITFGKNYNYNRALSLKPIRNMIQKEIEENQGKIKNRLILNTLLPWKVTEGVPSAKINNPITFVQLPELLEGLIEVEPALRTIKDTNFEITKYRKKTGDQYSVEYKDIVTQEDLAPLYNRITRKEYFKDFEKKNYYLNGISGGSTPSFTFEDFFTSNLETLLGNYVINIAGDLSNVVGTSLIRKYNIRRDSLEVAQNVLQALLIKGSEISKTTCDILDEYFGLEAGALLRIGSGKTETEDIETVDKLATSVINRLKDIIISADSSFKAAYNSFSANAIDSLIERIKTTEKTEIDNYYQKELLDYTSEKENLEAALDVITEEESSRGFLFTTYLQVPPNENTTIEYIPTIYGNISKIEPQILKRIQLYRFDLPEGDEKDDLGKTKAYAKVEKDILSITSNAIAEAINNKKDEIGEFANKPVLDIIRDLSFLNPAELEKLGVSHTAEEDEKIRVMRILLVEIWEILEKYAADEAEGIKARYDAFIKNNSQPTAEESFQRYLLIYHPGLENEVSRNTLNNISAETILNYVTNNIIIDINYKKPANEYTFVDEDDNEEPYLEKPSIAPSFTLPLPMYEKNEEGITNYNNIVPYEDIDGNRSNISIQAPEIDILPIDTTENILEGLVSFIETSLEGTDPKKEGIQKYVEYTAEEKKLKGRSNGLYYKRYRILNNRLHKSKGPLSRISLIKAGLKNNNLTDIAYEESLRDSYDGVMKVLEVEKVGDLTYMPASTFDGLVDSSVSIPGKFFYPAEIAAIKKQIGDQCILTCTKCSVKNTCPYYNEDTLIKANCTPATTIDLWFKDNKLDLLYYNSEADEEVINAKIDELDILEKQLGNAESSAAAVSLKYNNKIKEINELNISAASSLNPLEISMIKKSISSKEAVSLKLSKHVKNANNEIEKLKKEIEKLKKEIKDTKKLLISPNVYQVNDKDETPISKTIFQDAHKMYADIVRKNEVDYNNLIPIEYLSKEEPGLKKKLAEADIGFDESRDSLSFLLGGRYGTVELNPAKALFEEDNPSLKNMPSYNYLYDAVHILDEETEFNYAKSIYKYDVTLNRYNDEGVLERFIGNTYIQIPISLKLLAEASDNDDVYLVSDDLQDSNGQIIEPVIYLGKALKVRDLCTFDLMEGTTKDTLGAQSFIDSNNYYDFYPSDVAQWCVNYIKGNLISHPLNTSEIKAEDVISPGLDSLSYNVEVKKEKKNILKDLNENRDQFWMETIKKFVYKEKNGQLRKEWFSMPGRPRSIAKYQEPIMNPDAMDPNLIISGKPVVISYFNFIRRMSITMYDPNAKDGLGDWTIPWVNTNLPYDYKDANGVSLDFATIAEYKRKILQLMKTNLRLVVVKCD